MIYIQLIGILAFCIVVLSFYNKNPKTIIAYQILSNFTYTVHYFLLGALSGAFTSLVGIFRNIGLIKIKNYEGKKLLAMLVILCYLAITVIFFESFYSIFPMIANSTYLLMMLKGDRKSLIIGGIVSSSLWLSYGIFVKSYASVITESILLVSNIRHLILIKKSR
jgi:hypothetical protein